MSLNTHTLIESYYDAFNRQDVETMLSLLVPTVVHEPSQGVTREGIGAFREFLAHMNRSYSERVIDPVVMIAGDGTRAAAEFTLEGTYLATDEGLPVANGQRYILRVGAFFEIIDGKIARVSNHYNLADWIRQVETT
jgi:steroid delta-isomerase-like uncharacterized protein